MCIRVSALHTCMHTYNYVTTYIKRKGLVTYLGMYIGTHVQIRAPHTQRPDNLSVQLFFFSFLFFFPPLHFFPLCGKTFNSEQLHLYFVFIGLSLSLYLHISIQFRNHPNNRQYVAKAICHLQWCKNPSLLTISFCWSKKDVKDIEDVKDIHMNSSIKISLNPAKMQIVLSQSTIIIPLNFKKTETNTEILDRSTSSARTRQKIPSWPSSLTL